jgi:alkylation response protein AidB-like acyl-CoA dehydrogenase
MDFAIPKALQDYLDELDRFIDAEIRPLQAQHDNERFFDHRREHARTDWDNQGLPRPEWEALMREAKRRADRAGHLRFALPKEFGGKDGSNLWMTVIREHLATKGLGLHYDQQTEHSIVANNPFIVMFRDFGSPAQQAEFIEGALNGSRRITFGLTEPNHGSDATHMETRAVPEARDGAAGWRIKGEKMWTTGMHVATHCALFARTSGKDGDARGITCFLVPADAPGVKVEEYLWTFNMPTDHPRVSFTDVWVPDDAIFGPREGGLALAQSFVHENRIRQAAGSLGAAVYCIEESVKYARARKPFGEDLALNQAIQWPLVELHTQCEMLRLLIRKTAWEMDQMPHPEVEKRISDKVSMCNYWGNRLCCEAADRAMQVHGGIGYSRHKPFEHIYRHHRRYRITEGSEEIQMRKVAAFLFGYMGPRRQAMSALTWDDVDYRRGRPGFERSPLAAE